MPVYPLCKDCRKRYQQDYGLFLVIPRCSDKRSPEWANSCEATRLNWLRCGPEGKWFKHKITVGYAAKAVLGILGACTSILKRKDV